MIPAVSALALLGLTGCQKPWTAGAGPMAVPPPPVAAQADAPPPVVHSVKNDANAALAAALERFSPAYKQQGSPRVGLLVLSPGQQPFETWRVDVVGLGMIDGQPKATTLSGQAPLPGLSTSGWREEAAHVLQSSLVGAGVAVVDLPLTEWSGAEGSLPSELVFELRYVASDPLPSAQLRVLELQSGRVLVVERAAMSSAGGDAFGRATQKVLAQGLSALPGAW